jgi:hypothetical protein
MELFCETYAISKPVAVFAEKPEWKNQNSSVISMIFSSAINHTLSISCTFF